tara:strand:- start:216 stop:503 length:288 start_codon:yes stop_codon:yes gene_type:complete
METQQQINCKIGTVSVTAALIGALGFWLMVAFGRPDNAFVAILVLLLAFGGSFTAPLIGIASYIFGNKEHSRRHATFGILIGGLFAALMLLPLLA